MMMLRYVNDTVEGDSNFPAGRVPSFLAYSNIPLGFVQVC